MNHDRPSMTACVVAGATLAAFNRALAPTPSSEGVALTRRLLCAGFAGRLFVKSLDSGVGLLLWRWVERLAAPGFVQHIARRKAWIERACRVALAEGYQRVVIMGAGFDTLGPRLAIEAVAEVIELDHPATQQAKVSALGAESRMPAMISIDLASQLPGKVVGAHGDGGTRCTFMIIEGVLMYLPMDRVEHLLDDLAAMPCVGLRVAMTFMECGSGEKPGFKPRPALVSAWLRLVGEPFRWGATREQFATMLRQRGFEILDLAGGHDLERLWPGERLIGETAVLVERAVVVQHRPSS